MERCIARCRGFGGVVYVGQVCHLILCEQSNVGSTYGAAGSLVILLVWVYYSAIILYLGAEFAKAWTLHGGSSIRPNDYAVAFKQVDITSEDKIVKK
jgi:membrane protein